MRIVEVDCCDNCPYYYYNNDRKYCKYNESTIALLLNFPDIPSWCLLKEVEK